jgi:hypothetical protein
MVGAIVFAASNPKIDKLFLEPVGRLCRRGNQNPDRVFDTFDTHYGPMDGQVLLWMAIVTAVLSAVALACTRTNKYYTATILDLAAIIVAAVLLSNLLYVQRNPGCNNGITATTSITGRTGIGLLSIAFIITPLLAAGKDSALQTYGALKAVF